MTLKSSREPISVRPGRVLLVDKPSGPTSHDVVSRIRRAVGTRRVGHTGTLDPFASGLLLLCFESATRLAEYLTGLDKTYEASMRLGERTDTLDPEGEVVERDDAWRSVDRERVSRVLAEFVGDQDQIPPQFSAKKVEGEAMYRRARRGESVVLDAVRVRLHELRLVEFAPPCVRFMVRCSRGTYVRALARDLGEALGTCGYLTALRRTRIGTFDVDHAISLQGIEERTPDDGFERTRASGAELPSVERPRIELPWVEPLRAVGHLPSIAVSADEASRLAFGQPIDVPVPGTDGAITDGAVAESAVAKGAVAKGAVAKGAVADDGGGDIEAVALHLEGRLVAIAERRDGRLRPQKVFVDA